MTTFRDGRLADLLDQWEEAEARGDKVDPAELCRESPELLPELLRQIAALKAVDGQLELADNRPANTPRRRSSDDDASYTTAASYQDLEHIAQGGLGVVYRAVDGELHRDVALKFIHKRIATSEEHQETFRHEAQITSRLDHPGIVPVYGVGTAEDGRVFYVMRYVQGETLDAAIERVFAEPNPPGSLEVRSLLGHFVAVCKTIAYAHARGIIHRDIKPANVMLGKFGETLVVDWGLAAHVQRGDQFRLDSEQTLLPVQAEKKSSGGGSPAYMSPEALVHSSALSPAADIYSLGATLYKLLTGKVAFDARTFRKLRDQVARGDFPRPSHENPSISKPLEAICLKAMATEPGARYATALELAADIESYLADEPVAAYPDPVTRRLSRWARRHRGVAMTLVAGIIGLAAVTGISAAWLGYMANREHEARVSAESAKQHSLRMSAKFAARTIAGQVDLRWRILEGVAGDAGVIRSMTPIADQPGEAANWKPAQDWLNDLFIRLQNDHGVEFSSLFLLDPLGTQVARAPRGRKVNTIGQNFAYRDYFHGSGYDLPKEETATARPIRVANLSATYRSKTTGRLKVAFTVPISSAEEPGRIVGVLGMSVDLGEFGILETDLHSEHIVVLVDSRADSIDGELKRGLILQHPAFEQGDESPASERISDSALQRLDSSRATETLLETYTDPFSRDMWTAACERVIVDGRLAPVDDTGWVVLVQGRMD